MAAFEKNANRKMNIKKDKIFFIVIPPQLLSLVMQNKIAAYLPLYNNSYIISTVLGENLIKIQNF